MKKLIPIYLIFFVTYLYSFDVIVQGDASYYDVDLHARKPIVNAQIRIETESPNLTRTTYTDNNGHYKINIGSNYPDQVTSRIYFKNTKIDVRGYQTTHTEIVVHMKYIDPPPYFLIGEEFSGMDFAFTENNINNKYAKIFMMGNAAVNFTELNGYYPYQVIIRYPAEKSLSNLVDVDLESSFYWPYSNYTINKNNVALVSPFLASIFAATNLEAKLTSNTIYLKSDAANSGKRVTLFHEYGHFLMHRLRYGTWPISLDEYISKDESPTHRWSDYNQSQKQSWVEGWADFWGSAVESWYWGNTYQGKYNPYFYIFEYPQNYNSSNFSFSGVTDGYKNEVTVGSALFDFYDTANDGDADGLQIPISTLFNLINKKDNKFNGYVKSVYSTLSQSERLSLEHILNINKMELLIPFPQVSISGPTSLGYNVFSTFTANPSSGSGVYTNYRWWWRNDDGGILTKAKVSDIKNIPSYAPPGGYWYELTALEGQKSISIGKPASFSLKCEVTDSYGNVAEDIHSVYISGGISKEVKEKSNIGLISVPEYIELNDNYPNPFNPSTSIQFGLPEDLDINISIYSVLGQKVITLVDGYYSKGYHKILWDGKNQAGNIVSNGVYIYELKAGSMRFIKKMVFSK